jgi:hypothetical protein
MPSWLWRDWLGPAGRGPRGLLGRRPRRRLFLPPPPPPEGLPDPCPCPDGPAFIVLSKPAGPGFLPGAGLQTYRISATGEACQGSEPNARSICRKVRDTSRGSPRSFTAQKTLVQDDNQTVPLQNVRFPIGCGGLTQCWRTANFLAGAYPLTQSHPSTIKPRGSAPGGMSNFPCGIARWGWTQS